MRSGKTPSFLHRIPVFFPGVLTLYLVGFLLSLLGAVVICAGFGYPFSLNGVYGLLLIMFFLQFLSAGNTPLGFVPRTVPVLLIGFAGVGLGILSCGIPEFLEAEICLLIAVLTIFSGITNLRLGLTQSAWPQLMRCNIFLCGIFAMVFGVNMVLPFASPVCIGSTLILFGISLCTFAFLLNHQIEIAAK